VTISPYIQSELFKADLVIIKKFFSKQLKNKIQYRYLIQNKKDFKLNNFYKTGRLLMEHILPNKNLPGIKTGSLGKSWGESGADLALHSQIKKNKKVIILIAH
jgi:hypothetical protein